MDEHDLRDEICEIGRLMHQKGFVDASSGNISVRLPDGSILTTPSGIAKGFLSPAHLIVVDMDGQRIDEPTGVNSELHPTSELAMHLECYRQRDDVRGVVHAHPQNAIALTIADVELNQPLIPEMIVYLGSIATTAYATPASDENRHVIRDLVPYHDVLMLAHHGSVTVGRTIWEAYMRLEALEHNAAILVKVAALGGAGQSLNRVQIGRLLDVRRSLGLLRSNDTRHFLPDRD